VATITDIMLAGEGFAGSNRSWHVNGSHMGITNDGRDIIVKHLYHYGHHMLSWRADNPSDENYLDYTTGHGSVSDQGGMNRAFRALGIPRYFSRAGGAEIVETDPANAIALRDSYLRMRERYAWVR
jgi:hypothetical protein